MGVFPCAPFSAFHRAQGIVSPLLREELGSAFGRAPRQLNSDIINELLRDIEGRIFHFQVCWFLELLDLIA